MKTQPVTIPTLDSLAANPAAVQTLPPEMAKALWFELISLEKALAMRALMTVEQRPEDDTLLTVGQAAEILRETTDWLYRRADKLPFAIREGRLLRFSRNGIQKYIQARLRQK